MRKCAVCLRHTMSFMRYAARCSPKQAADCGVNHVDDFHPGTDVCGVIMFMCAYLCCSCFHVGDSTPLCQPHASPNRFPCSDLFPCAP